MTLVFDTSKIDPNLKIKIDYWYIYIYIIWFDIINIINHIIIRAIANISDINMLKCSVIAKT